MACRATGARPRRRQVTTPAPPGDLWPEFYDAMQANHRSPNWAARIVCWVFVLIFLGAPAYVVSAIAQAVWS